jgi:excisionase family DNA binding protein
MAGENLLSTAEVSVLLRVTPRHVARLAAKGDLPYVRKLPGLTSSYLFDRAVVEMYARHAAKAAS